MSRKSKIRTLEDTEIKQAEEKIKFLYIQKRLIKSNLYQISMLNERKQKIEEDIKDCNVFVDTDLKAIDYTAEKTSGGTNTGIDEVITNQINKMQIEVKKLTSKVLELKKVNLNLQNEIDDLEANIETLNIEYKNFIKLLYEKEKSLTWVAVEMYNGVYSTASRRKREILKSVHDMLKFQNAI